MNESLLAPLQYWTAGGPLLVPIAAVCLAMWAYFFRARRDLLATLDRLNRVETLSRQPGIPTSAIGHGLIPRPEAPPDGSPDAAPGGQGSLHHLFDQMEAAEFPRLSRDFVIVAALTAAAPLLGLLGTVAGMIDTFKAVAGSEGQLSSKVAGGISEALITTQFGLAVAIPGVFGLARLRRLLKQAFSVFARVRTHWILDRPDAAPATTGGTR